MDEQRIAEVVRKVLNEMQPAAGSGHVATCAGGAVSAGRDGVFEDINDAIAAAKTAFKTFSRLPMTERRRLVQVIRDFSMTKVREWAELTVRDTGMGRVDHKITKNTLAATLTPGPEDLETACVTGDKGVMLQEYAPFGVLGTITPSTNPVATVINHSIAMLSAGNTIVFGPHPGAILCTIQSMQEINRELTRAGAPPNLMTSVTSPNLQTAKVIMTHDDIDLLIVTGGPSVVQAAMQSPKRAIVAGPGNPPVVVDETCNIPYAASCVYEGSSFDNNMPCITEKECFVVAQVYDAFLQAIQNRGAYLLSPGQTESMARTVLTADGHVNRDFIGKDASVIAQAIGITLPSDCDLLLCEVDRSHPFIVKELMMPLLGIVKVSDYEQGITWAQEAEHGFRHTAVVHSQIVERITEFARRMDCNLFVANGSCGAVLGYGGEGWTAFTIAGKSGEGPCTPKTFSRVRRFASANGGFRIIG